MKASKATIQRMRRAYYALSALFFETPYNELRYLGFEEDERLEGLRDYLAHNILDEEERERSSN